MITSEVRWPGAAHPEQATIHVCNEAYSNATPEMIWAWLIRAREWPSWYANSQDVIFEGGTGPELSMGSKFRWTTFGVRVASHVEEFEPPNRVAWSGTAPGSTGYHAWVIERRDQRTRIVTEETQRGFIPFVAQVYLRRVMKRQHQIWVDELARRAASGPPK
jgi:hypothetical protein